MSTSPFDQDRPPEPPRRPASPGQDARRRRRADPNATVPEADFTSYYGRNVVKPAPWGNPIPTYLFIGGLAAGSGLLAAGGHATGRPRLRRRARIAAILGAAASGLTLMKDLGRPERAINMIRTVKLTSPMSVGTWILTGFSAAAGTGIATEVACAMVPRGSTLRSAIGLVDGLASAGTAFFAPPLAAYTAVLLADTASPTWHEAYPKLPFVFVASALAAGSGLALVTTPRPKPVPYVRRQSSPSPRTWPRTP
ncbi:NrfD/PsrC family molybdoenzyme membrane anchor subunit [Raineyella fluvialis]|uniref:NrfD/PsrC family molybdoenzyme membrane anchor subunit n=1 Tax=Raineyella fluvialis TaxID=2662261 RepID=UPI001E5F2931|nr:NrfD/PsrC family molybdoenzyme membrane anchor subunit [Raineyella fluvialis]